MSRTWEEIRHAMAGRRAQDSALIRRMIDVRDHDNGDIKIPMPTLPGEPEYNMLIPQIVHDGIEHNAMRAAGPMPNAHWPAVEESKDGGVRSLEFANIRRRAVYARWHESQIDLLLRRAYRQLIGYGTHAFLVVPDLHTGGKGGARIVTRDPLTSYPELRAPEEVREPLSVGFVVGRARDWILQHYPEARVVLENSHRRQYRTDESDEQLWDLVEWIDEDDVVLGILGPRSAYLSAASSNTPSDGMDMLGDQGLELKRWKNKAGMVPCVIPRRVTLDRIKGQMEAILPQVEWMAKLMALEVAAAERNVFPDIAIIGENDRVPKLVGGRWVDGRTGKANLLQDVKALQTMHTSPTPMSAQVMDRLERNSKQSGGLAPFFGAETYGSLRTGRAIDSLGGFSVDPRIQEVQVIMARALEAVNRSIIAVEKGYWPKRKFVVFSGWASDRGQVEYTPSTHFEIDDNVVTYTFPGTDMSEITVGVGQLTASGLMSRHTARDKHPFIDDAMAEERRIVEERVEDAILVGTQQKIASDALPLEYAVKIWRRLRNGEPPAEATAAVIEEFAVEMAEKQQAMMAGSMGPEVQPSLGQPQEQIPAISGPNQSQQNLNALVQQIAAARG